MTNEEVKRKLSAIFSADVKEYSRAGLMVIAVSIAVFEQCVWKQARERRKHHETV
jgi:hypothetical protein